MSGMVEGTGMAESYTLTSSEKAATGMGSGSGCTARVAR